MSIVGLALATPEQRRERVERRLQRAFDEYLDECRGAPPEAYDEIEQHAWRRLQGQRAECAARLRSIDGAAPVLELTEPVDGTPLSLPSLDEARVPFDEHAEESRES